MAVRGWTARALVAVVVVSVWTALTGCATRGDRVQVPTETAPAEAKVIPTQDPTAPFGVYIPKDLDDAFPELKKMLSPAFIQKIQRRSEADMYEGHPFGLDLWMGHHWALWRGSRLSRYFNDLGIFAPDTMSEIILVSFWRHLHGKPIDLDKQIALRKGWDEGYAELKQHPNLTRDRITSNSPRTLLEVLEAERGWYSEAETDIFYAVYADQLRAITDTKYPEVAQLRPQLIQALNSVCDLLAGLSGSSPGLGHYCLRNLGYIEWCLYVGASHNFSACASGMHYTLDDIREIGIILIKASWRESWAYFSVEPQGSEEDAIKMLVSDLEKAIQHLSEAESHMSEPMRLYFREILIDRISVYGCQYPVDFSQGYSLGLLTSGDSDRLTRFCSGRGTQPAHP